MKAEESAEIIIIVRLFVQPWLYFIMLNTMCIYKYIEDFKDDFYPIKL